MDELLYVTTKLLAAELARRSTDSFSTTQIDEGDINMYINTAKKIIGQVNENKELPPSISRP